MFDFNNKAINKVFNPLNITPNSIMEFNIGELKDTGIYRFSNIVELHVGEKKYARYLIYSKAENTEYVFEVFPGNNGQLETYLYELVDTVPFSDDFLEIVGQTYMTTPEGDEYERCIMPESEERIDGIEGKAKVYNIETNQIEKEFGIEIWDYQRDMDGTTEYLNVEMSKETGLFKIFIGEMVEDIFYKVYQASN